MALSFPADCDTAAERRVFVRRVWRKIMDDFNVVGAAFRAGKATRVELEAARTLLKARQKRLSPALGLAQRGLGEEGYAEAKAADYADARWSPTAREAD